MAGNNPIKDRKLKALEDTTEVLRGFHAELISECASISEQDFREYWFSVFFGKGDTPLTGWVQNVALNAQLPVNIVNNQNEVVCVIPPLFAGVGGTITSGIEKINVYNSLKEAHARGAVMPTQAEGIMIDAMMPFAERVGTDARWVAEWKKTLAYFEVDWKDYFGEELASELAPLQEEDLGEDDYDGYDEL